MTVRITGIAGSLRRESFNRRLVHAAAHEVPPGAELILWDGPDFPMAVDTRPANAMRPREPQAILSSRARSTAHAPATVLTITDRDLVSAHTTPRDTGLCEVPDGDRREGVPLMSPDRAISDRAHRAADWSPAYHSVGAEPTGAGAELTWEWESFPGAVSAHEPEGRGWCSGVDREAAASRHFGSTLDKSFA